MSYDILDLKPVLSNIKNLFSLHGKKALVIGGNKGLGQAMALALAASGADICVVGRGREGLEETAELARELGREGRFYRADVTVEKQVEAMTSQVADWFGRIDILVNSQGRVCLSATDEFDTNEWDAVINVNLKSVFLCCKYATKIMLRQQKGKIVNISSVRGFQGRANDLAYAPSKGAVNQLTRSLAIELGKKGINVNGIAPVFTLTKMSAPYFEDPKKKEWVLSRIPMNRAGRLEDLLGPIVFLCSEASNFVNGHILVVDGGWLAA